MDIQPSRRACRGNRAWRRNPWHPGCNHAVRDEGHETLRMGGATASRADASFRRAAANGACWMPTLLTPEQFREGMAQVHTYAQAPGRNPADIRGAIHFFTSIGPSYEAAASVLAPGIEAIFHAPFAAFAPLCLIGTPEQWREQIGKFAEVGVQHVNVLLYTRDLLGDVQQIGDEVAAPLRDLAAQSSAT
jgi:alkanesulfonate monooxygenase SsuD/methylene tetrahydromethanopterin reductase-like flavin-dependent oxidoreductase (luciferase family)